ncbi:N-acyl-D-aspartate/D-glutamate deacylase [Parenemella sanctibonifatiensis]|uniref:N-acyl-D-aspartate/D-glutamate deacylase n=1 Tax=Parenemella sanctibonifatiensis TaxID=2016505 RepID=A0A255EP32_9ACTN|nr:N-acyl-D-aspartate/D-glutamate deacylase [Parenemella sanctibonifatiensis]
MGGVTSQHVPITHDAFPGPSQGHGQGRTLTISQARLTPDAEPVDVTVADGRIVAIGEAAPADSARLEADGRWLVPGFVDTHSHADTMVRDPDIQAALLRQGITTVITGQDGVSPVPGVPDWADAYFGALLGPVAEASSSIADHLASCDGSSAVNVATCVPAGSVRYAVCGHDPTPATSEQRQAMVDLVRQGMTEGAVGLSSGLEYVPGAFSDTAELIDLCAPVAAAGGVYVSHLRGYEADLPIGMGELAAIAVAAGVRVHASHLHAPSELVMAGLAQAADRGADVSFDMYPYRSGMSLLAMPMLPLQAQTNGPAATLAGLRVTGTEREELEASVAARGRARPDLGAQWAELTTIASVADPADRWAEGLSLAAAAGRTGQSPEALVVDLLIRSELKVSVVFRATALRPRDDLTRILSHPAHLYGSDGIYVGGFPHPRGFGGVGRYLTGYVRGDLLDATSERERPDWPGAVAHLSTGAVDRFSLGRRGRIEVGAIADLALIDLDQLSDRATYADPRQSPGGIDDVVVAGTPVLRDGQLTGATPGAGVRRETRG